MSETGKYSVVAENGNENQEQQQEQQNQGSQEQSQEQRQEGGKQDVDYDKHISERFGADPDTIKSRLEKEQSNEALLQELKEANPYKSEFAKQVDDLVSEGMSFDQAVDFIKLDPTKMSDFDKIVFQLKNTTAKGVSDEDILNYIKEDLLGGADEDDLSPSQKIKLNELTAGAEKFLQEKKDSLKVNTKSRSSILEGKEASERMSRWESTAKESVQPKYTFSTKEGEVNFELAPEQKKEVENLVMNHLKSANLDPSKKEDVETVNQIANNFVKVLHFDSILELGIKNGVAIALKKEVEDRHNPELTRERNNPNRSGGKYTVQT